MISRSSARPTAPARPYRFWPDVKTGEEPEPGIFETGAFDFDTLKTRFREMAFLNKGIRITLRDERAGGAARG